MYSVRDELIPSLLKVLQNTAVRLNDRCHAVMLRA